MIMANRGETHKKIEISYDTYHELVKFKNKLYDKLSYDKKQDRRYAQFSFDEVVKLSVLLADKQMFNDIEFE